MGRRKPRPSDDEGGGARAEGFEAVPHYRSAGGGDMHDDADCGARSEMHPGALGIVDPATKQKVVLQWEQTVHTTGRANHLDNLAAGSKRDSYLCMLHQKGMCRSHHRCNQVHADRGRVQELRERFFTKHGKPHGQDEPLAHQRALEIAVVDPTDRQNRLVLPFNKTGDTQGRREYFRKQQAPGEQHTTPELEICPQFLQGAPCAQGNNCGFVHADRAFIRHAKERRPCCPFHGDGGSAVHLDTKARCIMVNKCNQRCPVPLERIAMSKGFREVPVSHSNQAVFASSRVCRLHQEKRCPWNSDCANLHVCREFYAVFAGCSNPTLQSLPSQPGLVITMSGRMTTPQQALALQQQHQMDRAASEPTSPASLGPQPVAPVTGQPLQTATPKEGYGIPLATSDGPVSWHLLPPQAQMRFPTGDLTGAAQPPGVGGFGVGTPWALPGTPVQWPFPQTANFAAMCANMAAAAGAAAAAAGQGYAPPLPAAAPIPERQPPPASATETASPFAQPTGPPPSVFPESLQKVSYADSEPSHTPPLSPVAAPSDAPQFGMPSGFPPCSSEQHMMLRTTSCSSVPPLQHAVSSNYSPRHAQQHPSFHIPATNSQTAAAPSPAPGTTGSFGSVPHAQWAQQFHDAGRMTPTDSMRDRNALKETRSERGQHLPYGPMSG